MFFYWIYVVISSYCSSALPNAPANSVGTNNYSGTLGALATYSCTPGYSGSPTSTCQADSATSGVWSVVNGSCTRMNCILFRTHCYLFWAHYLCSNTMHHTCCPPASEFFCVKWFLITVNSRALLRNHWTPKLQYMSRLSTGSLTTCVLTGIRAMCRSPVFQAMRRQAYGAQSVVLAIVRKIKLLYLNYLNKLCIWRVIILSFVK